MHCKCSCTWGFLLQQWVKFRREQNTGMVSSAGYLTIFCFYMHAFCFVMFCFSVALVQKSFPTQKNLRHSKINNINKTWIVMMNRKKHLDTLHTLHHTLYLMIHGFLILKSCKCNTLHTLRPNFFKKDLYKLFLKIGA